MNGKEIREKARRIAYEEGTTVTTDIRSPMKSEEKYDGREGIISEVQIDDLGLMDDDPKESIGYVVKFEEGDSIMVRHKDVWKNP